MESAPSHDIVLVPTDGFRRARALTSPSNVVVERDGRTLTAAIFPERDYNLLYVTGAGQTALWQGVARPTLLAWQNAAFTDANSIAQAPQFVDIDGADNLLLHRVPLQCPIQPIARVRRSDGDIPVRSKGVMPMVAVCSSGFSSSVPSARTPPASS